jgi:hypothetical protein
LLHVVYKQQAKKDIAREIPVCNRCKKQLALGVPLESLMEPEPQPIKKPVVVKTPEPAPEPTPKTFTVPAPKFRSLKI